MVYKWALQIPNLSPELTRRAYLYLPACYNEQPDARFPVMYMFDGHNVFFDEDATYGQSWGIDVYKRQAQIVAVAVGREALRRMVEHLGHVGHEVRERQIDGMLRVRQRRPRHSGHGGGQIVINLDGRAVHLTLDADHADIRAAGLLRIPLRPLKAGAGQFEDVAQADLFIRLIEQRIACLLYQSRCV